MGGGAPHEPLLHARGQLPGGLLGRPFAVAVQLADRDVQVAHGPQQLRRAPQPLQVAPDGSPTEITAVQPRRRPRPPRGDAHVVHVLRIVGEAHAGLIQQQDHELLLPDETRRLRHGHLRPQPLPALRRLGRMAADDGQCVFELAAGAGHELEALAEAIGQHLELRLGHVGRKLDFDLELPRQRRRIGREPDPDLVQAEHSQQPIRTR